MVGQVKVVGILMIVHGITVIIMGGLLIFLGVIVAMLPAGGPGGPGAGGPPAGFPALMGGVYIAIGVGVALIGLFNSIAGFRIMSFRNRTFALVALFLNVAVMFTCYCAPTAIGMMIYGLIVLFQPDVSRAFDMVAQGASPEDVVSQATKRFGDSRDDYDDEYRSPRYREERGRRDNDFDDRPPRSDA